MISSIKDPKQITNLISNLKFNELNVGNFVLASDMVKLPIFEFNHSGEFQKEEVLKSCVLFIDLYMDKINEQFFQLDGYNIDQFGYDPVSVREKFLELVSDLCDRSGKYKSTYDLMYQLTHYVSSMNVNIRVAVEDNGHDRLIPVFVASLTMDARNKLDKALNKTLELDTFKLNN